MHSSDKDSAVLAACRQLEAAGEQITAGRVAVAVGISIDTASSRLARLRKAGIIKQPPCSALFTKQQLIAAMEQVKREHGEVAPRMVAKVLGVKSHQVQRRLYRLQHPDPATRPARPKACSAPLTDRELAQRIATVRGRVRTEGPWRTQSDLFAFLDALP